jgi:ribosomal protein S13
MVRLNRDGDGIKPVKPVKYAKLIAEFVSPGTESFQVERDFIARCSINTSSEMAADVRQVESLSDEQIEKLIQEAEARAVAKHDSLTTMEADSELSLHDDIPDISKRRAIPGLKHGLERSGYIQDAKGVAKVKRSLMVNEDAPVHDLRALPPAQVQKTKVCCSLSTCPQRYRRKIIPNLP